MKMMIVGGRILDPLTGRDEMLDILLEDGKIIQIAPHLQESDHDIRVIDAGGLTVAPGLIDVHVHFRDPGLTYKEDILTGANAAARGGFTTVVCMANTKPPVDNVETLAYVLAKCRRAPINVLTVAAITKGMLGEELTDMAKLKAHGAVGFSDDGMPLRNACLVWQAMETAVSLNVPLSFHDEDPAFIANNGINHGSVAKQLGIGGSPALAEDVMVARDCMLALHTGAVVDIQHISSGNSVKLVQLAKELGAKVMAEVTPHHFALDESAVHDHGTLAKMNPPLRTAKDREMILTGLKDGTIELIATDHAPHSAEEKALPLTQAPSGIIGLETALALGITHLIQPGHLTLLQLMEKMSLNPARLYHLDQKGVLAVGADADLVIFDDKETWTVGEFASRSANSPFIGETLLGRVKYTICAGKVVYQD